MKFRYPGTRPFQENDRELFFGRNNDIEKLSELIVLEKLVVLFSKSGYGKSSLLNAGVIPKLKEEENFQTLNIRLNDPLLKPVELLAYHLETKDKQSTFLETKFNIPTELPYDTSANLWFNSKSIQLEKTDSSALLLIFDQFEELFNYPPAEIDDFSREIASLLNPTLPESVRKLFKQKMESSKDYFTQVETDQLLEPLNLKIVFSLRSDRISLLNQLKTSIPAVFKKTYELQPLNKKQALVALQEPAGKEGDFVSPKFSFSRDAQELILNSLIDKDHQRIETFQLQLICQHAEEEIIKKHQANPNSPLLDLTADELGRPEDIFENHYNTIISSLPSASQLKARILIEDRLIIGGNRVPLPESVIIEEHHISADLLKTLVDKRLLRSEPNTVGGMSFELSHDTLVAPIQKTARIRRLKESEERAEKDRLENAKIQNFRRTRILLGIAVIALVFAVFATIFAYNQKNQAEIAAKTAVKLKIEADIAKDRAVASENEALIAKHEALELKDMALASENEAVFSKNDALVSRDAAEASKIQFQKQAAISKSFLLASTVKDLLERRKDFYALRVAEAAYKSALEAGPEPPSPILVAISEAFYHSETLQISIFEGHQERVTSVAISPDGNSFLTGSADNTAILWDIKGNQIKNLKGHQDWVVSVAFSSDGMSLLTGSNDKTAILWDTHGTQIQKYEGHQDAVTSIAFSPDGKSVLTGSTDNTVILWDTLGTQILKYEGHQEAVTSIAFSPDGKSILTGSLDNTAIHWDINGKQIQKLEGHNGYVTSVAFSPDGKSFLTGNNSNTAILWNKLGNQTQIFGGHTRSNKPISSVAFSPDGQYILTGGGGTNAILWDTTGNLIQEFKGHQQDISSVAFSPDGKSILTGSLDNTASLWDIEEKPIQKFEGHKDGVTSVAFSPNRNTVLTGSLDTMAILWDTNGNQIQKFKGHSRRVTSVAISPDGNFVLTGSRDQTAIIWDMIGNQYHRFEGQQGPVESVAFSPDGSYVLTGNRNNTASLWEIKNKKIKEKEFSGHSSYVFSVAFSPDGKLVLTGSADGSAIVWDIEGNLIQKFAGHNSVVFSVAFSQDGYSILTGSWDNTAILWDTTGRQIRKFEGHQNKLTSVMFSSEGNLVLTGSEDKTAILWDIKGKLIQKFEGHLDVVTSVDFSPNGNSVLTGSGDKTAILWKTPQGIYNWLQSQDCPLRQLTEAEKVLYGIIEGKD